MMGKTVIVTGANSGIGKATAADIVRQRGRVIMACRDVRRAEAAAEEILSVTGAPSTLLSVRQLDLASLASVHAFCQDVIQVGRDVRVVLVQYSSMHEDNGTQSNVYCSSASSLRCFLVVFCASGCVALQLHRQHARCKRGATERHPGKNRYYTLFT